jgi:tetratricopeptide (TPR) repeat protein
VLLDQKRTRRIVQVVAILTSLAFAGVIFVVIAFVIFGGGGGTQGVNSELISAAQDEVDASPDDPNAWGQLAAAYAADQDFQQAIPAAEKAVELSGGDDYPPVRTLVSLQIQNNNPDGAIAALSDFTAENPDNADAFLQLGTLADQNGRIQLARLSYQRFLVLNPDDSQAPTLRDRIRELEAAATETTG